MKRPRLEPSHLYAALISCLGIGLLMFLGFPLGEEVQRPVGELALLVVLVIAGELMPIRVTREGEVYELTTSTTFSFALLLGWGLGPALLAQTAGSLCADLVRHKPLWKATFNVAQYAIALTCGAVVLSATTALPRPALDSVTLGDMPGILAAIAVIYAVNSVTMGGGIALSQGMPLGGVLRAELSPVPIADALLLLLSPVMIALTDESYVFILLVLIPLITISMVSRQNSKLVSELRGQAEENQYQALHDSLTGLPNRTLMRDRVDQAVRNAEREAGQCAVMIMDLDRFKEVNDSLGHHNGDELLKKVAARLRKALRQSDTVARLGGDEFAVLLPRIREAAAATSAAKKMLGALEAPFNLEGLTLEIGASVGIALYPQNGVDADTLFQRADVAMYAAKERRAGCEIYATEHDHFDPARLTLVAELRRAIDHRELELHYQPMASAQNGHVRGMEALVRWRHPEHGLIFPDQFIPLAEHTGLIRPLTAYVLDAALAQCKQWHESGLGLFVSVNLSAQSLLDVHFPQEVEMLLGKWHVPAPWLKLELTESSIMSDPVRALRVLTKLSAMRLSLSIDDFGTGYSSFAYLRRLPVNTLKIDRSFVMGMESDDNDEVIVQSIVDLGRNLGLETVAEGVENQKTWDSLARFGCDIAQGYFLSRPMPAETIDAWLSAWADRIPELGNALPVA